MQTTPTPARTRGWTPELEEIYQALSRPDAVEQLDSLDPTRDGFADIAQHRPLLRKVAVFLRGQRELSATPALIPTDPETQTRVARAACATAARLLDRAARDEDPKRVAYFAQIALSYLAAVLVEQPATRTALRRRRRHDKQRIDTIIALGQPDPSTPPGHSMAGTGTLLLLLAQDPPADQPAADEEASPA